MKISRNWLQTFFDTPLPDASALGEALTFHAFEIEDIEGDDILDVKVTANRGHDCLCHRGIAKELSAILNIPIKSDPLRSDVGPTRSHMGDQRDLPSVSIRIEDPALCPRYIAGYIKGVSVGPSPEWLRNDLEAIGQKSINNIVDATNFVMFTLGQPLHAFDAGKLSSRGPSSGKELTEDGPLYSIGVRKARDGEKITTLDGKEYALSGSDLLIVDENADTPIGIAGVKGGMPASITSETKDIIIESANFDGISVRRTAQALKLRTDASSRFEQVISSELAAYGMKAVVELIIQIAGGEVVGFADEYPVPPQKATVSVTTSFVNKVLGSSFGDADVIDALKRLDLAHVQQGEEFTVHVPFERLDLSIPEDLVEEVGRIVGYDKISAVELPAIAEKPQVNTNFYAAEHAREEFISQGYSEVFTSVFTDKGERIVANKADGVRPYLRESLTDGLSEALKKNIPNKDLLALKEIKLFEIGTIWKDGKEEIVMGSVSEKERAAQKPLDGSASDTYEDLPLSQAIRYQPFSKYPYIVRDIAMWVPSGTDVEDVLRVIREHAGTLLMRAEKFDEFKKGDKVSYAFRLIFQSFDKTLTDGDANQRMESISSALKEKGFEIR